MEGTNKNAVIYAQVKSNRQMKHGNGIKSQQTLCGIYAKNKGINIVESFQDGGTSGRNGLNEMIEYLKFRNKYENKIDYVIIEDIDRLCGNIPEWLDLRSVFEDECKVKILSLNQKIDNSPESRMIIMITLTIKSKYHGMNK